MADCGEIRGRQWAEFFFAAMVLTASIGWATSGLTEGALAVGMPEGNPNNGFRWSLRVDNPDAAGRGAEVVSCFAHAEGRSGLCGDRDFQ